MNHFCKLAFWKKQSSVSTHKKEEQYHLKKNGSELLKELLALCDGNCRIPIRYFSASEIKTAIKHSEQTISDMIRGKLGKRFVLIRFIECYYSAYYSISSIYRDIAITAQMSHLKNVLRLVGCCLEFERPVMVYEYVDAITLADLLYKKDDHISWGKRLRIANEIASAVVYLHSEFNTPIIHREVSASNVLIDRKTGVAKLYNFKWSFLLPPGKKQVQVPPPSDVFIHHVDYYCINYPEYWFRGITSQKTDVYTFGVILLELLTGKKVMIHLKEYRQANVTDIVDQLILQGHGTEIRQQLEDYFLLLKKCLFEEGEDGPFMIHVAKELRRIEACFRARTLR